MSTLRKLSIVTVMCLLLIALCSASISIYPVSAQTTTYTILLPFIAVPAAPSAQPALSAEEQRVVERINANRPLGCTPLRVSSALTTATQQHSLAMGTQNFFDTTGPDGVSLTMRAHQAGYPLQGRSCFFMSAGYASPDDFFGFLGPWGHLEDCSYQTMGVGHSYVPGSTYKYYWTLLLGDDDGVTATPTATLPTPLPTAIVATPTVPLVPTPTPQNSGMQEQVVELVNQERAKISTCKALTIEARLTQAAQGHANDMTEHDFVSHTGSDGSTVSVRVQRTGYDPSLVGENVAGGYLNAQTVFQGWMESPGHRENMLDCGYTQIGIGYAQQVGTTYTHYWVMDLARP